MKCQKNSEKTPGNQNVFSKSKKKKVNIHVRYSVSREKLQMLTFEKLEIENVESIFHNVMPK